MTMSVTLIIPILNEVETLPSLLEAIRRQSLLPQDIYFCDAGSTDGSVALIERSRDSQDWGTSHVRVLINIGAMPGEGRNAGVRAATTDWVAFLDGGIDPERDWLEQLCRTASINDVLAVFGLCYFSAEGSFPRAVCALSYGQGSSHPVIPSTLFKRVVFDEIGFFPEHLRAAEDIVWIDRYLSRFGPRTICSKARSHYSHFPMNWKQALGKWRLFEKNSVLAGVRSRQHFVYLLAIPFLYAGLLSGARFGMAIFLLYAIFRGIADPIRRSASWNWWRGYPSAAVLALPLALAIDLAKLTGIAEASFIRLAALMSAKKK